MMTHDFMGPNGQESNHSKGLIVREFNNFRIGQRQDDAYLNATAMCKAAGKEWSNYFKSDGAKAFIDELAGSLRIGRDLLVVSITAGPNDQRGTWVHPQVGYHLGQWISPAFAVKVTEWISDLHTHGFTTVEGVPAVQSGRTSVKPKMPRVASEFRGALSLCKMLGLSGNEAKISAAHAVKAVCDVDVFEVTNTRHLISEAKEISLTVSELSALLNRPHPRADAPKINNLFEANGWQTKDSRGRWRLTSEGMNFGEMVDQPRAYSDVGSVRSPKWFPSKVLAAVRDLFGTGE